MKLFGLTHGQTGRLLVYAWILIQTLSASVQAQPAPTGNSLKEFLEASIEFSPELKISKERLNVSSFRKDQAVAGLLPQISASANLSDNTRESFGVSRDYEGERYAIGLSQVIWDYQAFMAKISAGYTEDASEAEYFAQLSVLLTQVADRYLSVLNSEDNLSSLRSEKDAISRQVQQLQSLFDRQLVPITALLDSQAREAQVSASLVDAESKLELDKAELRALSGLESGELKRLPGEIIYEPLSETLSSWIVKVRNNNKYIEAREYAYQSSQYRAHQARGAFMPKVSLAIQQQKSNLGFDNIPIDEYDSVYVGINLQVPIYLGGANSARLGEALSLQNIADEELRATRLEIENRARTAYLQVRSGESRIEAGKILLQSAQSNYEAMQRGFSLGTVTSVDLLNALSDRFKAERDLSAARYDHLRASLSLRNEAGELTVEDLLEISNQLQ